MIRIPFETMQNTIAKAFVNAGLAPEDAECCARVHTESSCDGVYSHGLNRVARFVDFVQRGWVNKDAKPSLVRKLGAIEIYDGNRGIGILNAFYATERAMALAEQNGVGIVSLRNTAHWMRGGTFGWHAVERGFIALCWTNTESAMPAWGGKNPRVGNNPLVMAVPREQGPLVLDMAMSQYSYGKLHVMRMQGKELPYPGGFNEQGELTTSPIPIEQTRRVLPIGYWKGSGLAILLDTLAAVLSEGLATNQIDKIQQGSCTGCSQVFILIDPRQLGGAEQCEAIANGVADYIHGSVPDEQGKMPTYPGESTLHIRAEHRANGILADENTWDEVLLLAK